MKTFKNYTDKRKADIQSKLTNLDSLYDLSGVCSLIVYINKEASLRSMKKLLIYDLMRSMYARVRLLVEDLDARKEIIGDEQLEDDPSCKLDRKLTRFDLDLVSLIISLLKLNHPPLKSPIRHRTEFTSF